MSNPNPNPAPFVSRCPRPAKQTFSSTSNLVNDILKSSKEHYSLSQVKDNDLKDLNESKLNQDLESNWAVVAEAIQTVLRREQYPKPYEALKDLTRGKSAINKESIHKFIDGLDVTLKVKRELKKITPFNYTGVYTDF